MSFLKQGGKTHSDLTYLDNQHDYKVKHLGKMEQRRNLYANNPERMYKSTY